MHRAVSAGLAILAVWGCPAAFAAAPGTVVRDHPQAPELVVLPRFSGHALAMARTETTFAQWDACAAAGACRRVADDHGWGRGNRPVINVSWEDAAAYARWLSGVTGRRYRLPTEAEWDFAARAGTREAYWWGEAMKPGMARCRGCNPGVNDYGTLPAASYPANPFGLYDMNGNVWEWVADCATEASVCAARVTRGGAWYYFSNQAKAAARAPRPPAERSFTVGFRVVSDR